jgi:hypothetical protein
MVSILSKLERASRYSGSEVKLWPFRFGKQAGNVAAKQKHLSKSRPWASRSKTKELLYAAR